MDFIASLCERIIVLAEGAVLTEGTMAAVRRDPRVIDAYLGGGEEDAAAHDASMLDTSPSGGSTKDASTRGD